ncbi:TPA: hypothetical protein DCF80_00915 [Candidatus Saccharibacteria bacterium]|nr:hypothetical protein [Candidatus Saccharibacteria bacterium]
MVFGGIVPSTVFAADTTANTLKVTPVRSDIEIPAGQKKTVPVTVSNVTDSPILVRAITNDFVAGDERGTPAIILDPNAFAPTHSLKRFMSPIADVTIPAGKSKVVEVVITVPANAQAGGYFGAVRFAPTDPDGGGQVNLSASVASLILMTVPGPTVDKLTLTDFTVKQKDQSNWYFTTPNDITLTFRLENKGNVQQGPFGKITVKKGDEVIHDVNFNEDSPRDMVLPNSARRWDVPLEGISGFGQYTVTATLTYGAKNQTIQMTETFWIIPVWVMIAVGVGVVLLLLLIVLIWWLIRRRRNRRVSLSGGYGLRRR